MENKHIGFENSHELELGFQGQILRKSRISGIGPVGIEQKGHDRDLLVTRMKCKDLPDSDGGDFRCRRAIALCS